MAEEQTNSVGDNAHAYQIEALQLEEEMEKELKGEHVHYFYVHDLINRVKKTDQVVYTLQSGKPFPHFGVVQQQLVDKGFKNLWHRWQIYNCNDKPHMASHSYNEVVYNVISTPDLACHGAVGMTRMPKLKTQRMRTRNHIGGEMLTVSEIAAKYDVRAATVRARIKVGKHGMDLVTKSTKGKAGQMYEVNGEMLTITQISWQHMINAATVRARIKRGLTGADLVA